MSGFQSGDQNSLNKAVTPGVHAVGQLENSAIGIGDKLRVVSWIDHGSLF